MWALSELWALAGREGWCPLSATAWQWLGSFPTHPPGLVMALASSARSAPGLGAFGGFESQFAELFLRTNQREKAALGRGQKAALSHCCAASCSENRGVSTLCKLLGQFLVTRRTGRRIRELLSPAALSTEQEMQGPPPTSQPGPVTRG